MKIVDAHAHIFPDKIAEKAVQSISDFYQMPMKSEGYADALIKSGDEIGVDKYLVFSTATKASQVESIDNFIIEQVKKYPQFIGLGTMFPGFENYEDELLRLKENNIKGIKLHPDFQRFNFDDERLYPVFDAAEQMNMFVLTHAGDYRYGYSHPERIAKIAKKFKNLKIIAAHFGGWSQWDIAFRKLVLPNVYYDTSSTFGFTDVETVKRAFKIYDNSHIFFASDFPMWNHKTEFENLQRLGLKERILEDVMGKNFYDFYNSIK